MRLKNSWCGFVQSKWLAGVFQSLGLGRFLYWLFKDCYFDWIKPSQNSLVLCSSPETLSRKLWKKLAGTPVYYAGSNENCHVPKFELPDNTFKPKKIHNIECNPKSNRLLKFSCKLMPPHHFNTVYSVRSACKLRARRTEYKSVFFHTT